jgi:hypothetical protein
VKPPSPTIDLVCSVLLTSGEGWVKMPVAREIWESGEAREFLIQKVREELVSVVLAETGVRLDDALVAGLPVAVRDPDVDPEPPAAPAVCEVVCVGGPRDGSRVKLNRAHPGLLVLLPREPSLTDLFDAADGVLEPSRHLHYVPIVDDEGHFSRADDGAWRFRYDGAR